MNRFCARNKLIILIEVDMKKNQMLQTINTIFKESNSSAEDGKRYLCISFLNYCPLRREFNELNEPQ